MSYLQEPNFQLKVALGLVDGWQIFRKFGMNPDVDTGTVTVQGLDSNYDEVEETVTMDGTTPALTTQTFLRVNRAFAVTAGSNGTNVGNISISVGGDLQAYIEANQGQTHQTHYTVPRNRTLLVTSFHITGGRMANADMQIWSQIKTFNGSTAWRTLDDTFMYQNNFDNDHDIFVIPAKTEIRQRIVATTTNGEVACTWSGYLVIPDRAVALVDELHTSEEEKLALKAQTLDTYVGAIEVGLKYEQEALAQKAEIIKAEANSKFRLAAVWRPVTMLGFLAA
jgi:hypothetical protein